MHFKAGRRALLNECAAVSGLERNHLIKVPGGKRPTSTATGRRKNSAAPTATHGSGGGVFEGYRGDAVALDAGRE